MKELHRWIKKSCIIDIKKLFVDKQLTYHQSIKGVSQKSKSDLKKELNGIKTKKKVIKGDFKKLCEMTKTLNKSSEKCIWVYESEKAAKNAKPKVKSGRVWVKFIVKNWNNIERTFKYIEFSKEKDYETTHPKEIIKKDTVEEKALGIGREIGLYHLDIENPKIMEIDPRWPK